MSGCMNEPKKTKKQNTVSKCLVFGASGMDASLARGYYAENEPKLVLCADGGLCNARKAGLRPDAVIGDADSGGEAETESAVNIRLPREKDISDLQACLDYGLDQGASDFVLFGCSGGRPDHFLANVFLLEYLFRNSARGVLADEFGEIYFHAPGTRTFRDPGGFRYLSVLALSGEVTGVTLEGLKYPLCNAVLRRASTLGLSNEPLDGMPASVHTECGDALIIRSRDPIP